MKKQTAVEWLFKQISNSKYFYKLMKEINSKSTIAQSNIFEQAKEMEKEQIIDTYETSHISMMTAEQYYNETFNKKA